MFLFLWKTSAADSTVSLNSEVFTSNQLVKSSIVEAVKSSILISVPAELLHLPSSIKSSTSEATPVFYSWDISSSIKSSTSEATPVFYSWDISSSIKSSTSEATPVFYSWDISSSIKSSTSEANHSSLLSLRQLQSFTPGAVLPPPSPPRGSTI